MTPEQIAEIEAELAEYRDAPDAIQAARMPDHVDTLLAALKEAQSKADARAALITSMRQTVQELEAERDQLREALRKISDPCYQLALVATLQEIATAALGENDD